MISIETKRNYTLFKVAGEVNADKILIQASKYLSGNPSDRSLWDFTKAANLDISTVELIRIAQSIKEFSTDGKSRKVALVSSKSTNIGLGKLFVAIAEIHNLPHEYQAFRTIDLAMDWLGKGKK